MIIYGENVKFISGMFSTFPRERFKSVSWELSGKYQGIIFTFWKMTTTTTGWQWQQTPQETCHEGTVMVMRSTAPKAQRQQWGHSDNGMGCSNNDRMAPTHPGSLPWHNPPSLCVGAVWLFLCNVDVYYLLPCRLGECFWKSSCRAASLPVVEVKLSKICSLWVTLHRYIAYRVFLLAT